MIRRVLSKGMRHIMAPRGSRLKDLLTKEPPFCPALWIAGKRRIGASHGNG